ncbi:MAG: transglutaminase family protein [Candidatus Zixiibacteriota bacterium]
MRRTLTYLFITALIIGCVSTQSFTADYAESSRSDYSLCDLPSIPEQDVDIGLWALVIAKECDSSVQINKYLHTLDTMALRIQYMVGPREGDMVRLLMTKMYQFEPGEWNSGNIFSYDLNDPFGEQPGARLLTTYLDTRKGNCVSMPTLFLALMERVAPDVPFNGVSAPLHLFCRLHDRQDGNIWNVESTNGGEPAREQWYIKTLGISRLAIDSGSYMRDLTKKDFIAELLGILVSKYRNAREYEKALDFAELMLKLNPRSLNGLVQKGALLAWVGLTLQEQLMVQQRHPSAEEADKLGLYKVESDKYIERARTLGWEPETPGSREDYLRTIRAAQSIGSK